MHKANLDMPNQWAQNLEIFDLKQLADKEAQYRQYCRDAIRHYRAWQREQSDQTDMIEILYGAMEGDLYRNRVSDSVKIYWTIRKHFRTAFARYLEKTGCYPVAPSNQNVKR